MRLQAVMLNDNLTEFSNIAVLLIVYMVSLCIYCKNCKFA